jgi:hypothetical protein
MLIQITTTYFCAGIIAKNNIIIKAAPILKWTIGKDVIFVKNYFSKKKVLLKWYIYWS